MVQFWDNPNALGQAKARAWPRAPGFCYKCGESGHKTKGCLGQKTLSCFSSNRRPSGGVGKPGKDRTGKSVPSWALPDSGALALSVILEGLIGPRAEVPVVVNGHGCAAILDNGFQVTILFESLYKKMFQEFTFASCV